MIAYTVKTLLDQLSAETMTDKIVVKIGDKILPVKYIDYERDTKSLTNRFVIEV